MMVSWHSPTMLACRWILAATIATFVFVRNYGANSSPLERAVEVSSGDDVSKGITKPIESLKIGERVLASNPQIAPDERNSRCEPNWNEWLSLRLKMRRQDGSELDIELLRPESWVLSHRQFVCQRGDASTAFVVSEPNSMEQPSIHTPIRNIFYDVSKAADIARSTNAQLIGMIVNLDLPELGIAGPAVVKSLDLAADVCAGEGSVVTGTFRHVSTAVLDLFVSAPDGRRLDKLGTTSNHPFWSVDREDYVPANELRIGEKLTTHAGATRIVTAKQSRSTNEPVYNLEVWGEHVYFVGLDGILVHNTRNYNRIGGTGDDYNEHTGQGIYILRDANGNIRYVGRGDAPQRLEAHAQPGSGKEDLKGEILFNNNLPAAKAKSLEQELMHMLGGPLSVNPSTPLRNKIQGIGEGNPNFTRLEFAASDELVFELLRRAGLLGGS